MPDQAEPISNDQQIKWENVEISDDIRKLVSIESIEKYGFIPFSVDKEAVNIAVISQNDINTQNAIRFFGRKIDKSPKVYVVSEDIFQMLLGKFKNPEYEIGKALDVLEKSYKEEEIKESKRIKKRSTGVTVLQEAPVAKMVEVILKNAIDGNASDIHIEPMEDNVRVRYRVDGVLYNSIALPSKVGPAIVSRVKILSNLKIDEKRKPQDGRFRINDLGNMIDFRVSTFPVSHGEKVVMRILDKSAGLIDLEKLGLGGKDLKLIKTTIEEPFGILLVTGPTGSGKSTTLYSALSLLNKVGVNIVTLEDPVEYVIEGVSQSQVKPEIGYTFASGLRSILRQDPDIVMVGEIRDSETAELAIHAALTGHLVLSTLHTNSALGAIPRLIDMGVQSFLISSALKMVIGQRLVRRICPECKEEKKDVLPTVLDIMKKELASIPAETLKELDIDPNQPIKLYEGKGCNHCRNNGMKGRVGIYEVLEVNDKISSLVGEGKSENEILKFAQTQGYTTMKQDGIIKILKGLTTFEEVQRVTEDESEEEVIQAKGE